jgi:hypothetical protein
MGATRGERLAALAALATGEDAPGLVIGAATPAAKTAVVFTGHDVGIGDTNRRLAERFPAFAEAVDDVCAQLDAHLDGSLRALLNTASGGADASGPGATDGDRPPAVHRHASVFAFQTALYRLIRSFGVTPDLVAGSGIGAITAAHAAGVLSLADAGALAVAAARTLAGEDGEDGEAQHGLRTTAERIGYAKPQMTIVSDGEPADPEQPLSPDYWASGDFLRSEAENVLRSVRSQDATACLELGPEAFSTARPDESPADRVLHCLAEAYTAGTDVSWEAAFTGTGAGQVDLPSYPFQRKRYWLTTPAVHGYGVHESGHPLLGGTIDLADSAERRFTRTLTARDPWYIAQYRLCGTPALPSAAVVEWALALSRRGAGESDAAWTIENLTIREPLTLPGGLAPTVQTAADTHGATRRIRGFSRDPGDAGRGWTLRFTAMATREERPAPGPADLGRLRSRMAEEDPGPLFARHGEAGIDYGPAFRHIVGRWRTDDESLVLIDAGATGRDPYVLDPVVLETCFLSAMPLVSDSGLWLPSGLERLTCYRELPRRLWCHARRAHGDAAQGGPLSLDLFSDSGEPLAAIAGLTYTAADPARLAPPTAISEDQQTAAPWDAGELTRLALEEPEAARRTLTDLLFGRVITLAEGAADDPETLRERFGGARLGELGLDSLRMMRLREQLHAQLLVDVPPQRLLGDATVTDIVDMVCRFLAARNLLVTGDEPPDTAEQIEELVL